nr:exosortase F system-associated protein [Flavobacterium sp. H122]
MLLSFFKYKSRIILLVLLTGILLLIRNFETCLFYDPFTDYFKYEFIKQPYPKYDFIKLVFGLLFRYGLNSLISLAVIYVVFEDKSMVKIASVLFFFFLMVLLPVFVLLLTYFDQSYAMVLFYVRRFLIQPLFLILFIPAFYYQKKNS